MLQDPLDAHTDETTDRVNGEPGCFLVDCLGRADEVVHLAGAQVLGDVVQLVDDTQALGRGGVVDTRCEFGGFDAHF